MPDVGDRVRVASVKVGQVARDGEVTSVLGPLLRIRWSTGEESTIVPGPGSVAVIGRGRPAADEPDPEAPKDSTIPTLANELNKKKGAKKKGAKKKGAKKKGAKKKGAKKKGAKKKAR